MSESRFEAATRRQRNWRIGLISIIVVTLPFYCVGLFLWGTAPQRAATATPTSSGPQVVTATSLPSQTPTATPLGFIPSITPLPITVVAPTQVFPTQIIASPFPTFTQVIPTRFLSPTPTFPQPTVPPQPTTPPVQPTLEITNTPLPF